MYPRNAASPERIDVGAVVQISDGAVQTSGVSISVRGQGGASGAGSGTTAYDNGIVQYTPTQGETDFTSFIVVAYKTGCIPASKTVITSASSVPGRTMPADGSITAAVIATDAIDADSLKADAVTEIQNGLATPTNITAGTITTVTNLTNAPTNGDLTATMKTSVTTAATAATPNLNAAYDAAKTAAQAGDAMALTSSERTTLAGVIWTVGNMATAAMKRIADFVLRRNTANAAASTETGLDTVSFRSPIGAVRKLTNKVDTTTNSGKLTIFEEDDTTQAATQTLSTDASAEPITGANTD